MQFGVVPRSTGQLAKKLAFLADSKRVLNFGDRVSSAFAKHELINRFSKNRRVIRTARARNKFYRFVRIFQTLTADLPNFQPIVRQRHKDRRKTAREIVQEVADKHGFSVIDLQSARRFKSLCEARFEACYRMIAETTLSYPQVGMWLGNRDHTTVLHAVKQYAKRNNLPMLRGGKA